MRKAKNCNKKAEPSSENPAFKKSYILNYIYKVLIITNYKCLAIYFLTVLPEPLELDDPELDLLVLELPESVLLELDFGLLEPDFELPELELPDFDPEPFDLELLELPDELELFE